MADNVIFKTGALSNLDSVTKKAGQVLFAIDGNNRAYINFDKDANTRCDLYVKVADEATTLTGLTVSAVDLNDINNKAPTSHASSATTYGKGTSSAYGHLKLSDAINSTSSTSSGVAATPKAVKTAYDLANTVSTDLSTLNTTVNSTINSLTISGKTITYTTVGGTSGTLTTQDTNTHYIASLVLGATSSSSSNATTTTLNPYLNLREDSTIRSSIQITGGTNISVSGINGIISIRNTYTLPTASSTVLGGVKVGDNINLLDGVISLNSSNVISALSYTPVNKAGDTMTSWLHVKGDYLGIGFKNDDGTDVRSQIFAVPQGTNGSGLRFGVKAIGSDNWEFYTLPYSNSITGHKYYTILTTRDTLTVAQGGTGATTAADACSNLGAVKKSGDTMSGDLTVSNSSVARVKTTCGSYSIGLFAQGSETGLYDYGKNKYIVWGQDGDYTFNGTANSAVTANTLSTGRYFHINLGSTSNAYFDGSANCSPGIKGTLGIANGGTGATTAAAARTSLGIIPGNILIRSSTSTNINNWLNYGSYGFGTSNTNRPNNENYGMVWNFVSDSDVHNNSSNWIWQLGLTTTSDSMYLRKKVNNGSWSTWKALALLDNVVKKSGDTMTGDLTVKESGGAHTALIVENGNGKIGLLTETNRGLWDYTLGTWIVKVQQNGVATFNGTSTYTQYFAYTDLSSATNADLNDYTTPGCYACRMSATAATMSHCPVNVAFTLLVLPNAGCTQILIAYGQNTEKIYVRGYYNGSWYGWHFYQADGGVVQS